MSDFNRAQKEFLISQGMDAGLKFCIDALAELFVNCRHSHPTALPGIEFSLMYLKGVQAGISQECCTGEEGKEES
jgi:hypothetical protein